MHSYTIVEKGEPLVTAKKALILLHGRGAMAEDILPLAGYFVDEGWYVAAPQATNNVWYPYSFMAPVEQNEPWLSSAIDVVHTLLQNTSRILPPENIYVMGFSQGACLASEVSARYAQRYGGIIAFTGGLIGKELDTTKYGGNFNGTPIYLSNGSNDPHVPLSRSEETKTQLEKQGGNVVLDVYPNRPHTILPKEIEQVKSFVMHSKGRVHTAS